jgi:DNA-binding PucR family transcriptional regulator
LVSEVMQSKHNGGPNGRALPAGTHGTRPAVCGAAVDCLRPRLDEIATEIAAAIHRDIPRSGADPALIDGTRASVLAIARHLLALAEDDGDHRRIELPLESTRLAREFVHLGVGLAGLLRAVRIAHTILWRCWLSALRERFADPMLLGDAVELASRLQFAFMDTLSLRLADEYSSEKEQWARSADSVRVDTVRAIVEAGDVDPDLASPRLGYELRRQHIGFVVAADAPGEAALAETRSLAMDIARHVNCPQPLLVPMGAGVLGGWIGGSAALELDGISEAALGRSCTNGAYVAIGTMGDGVMGFRRTHIEATHARRIAMQNRGRPARVTRYATVALASIACADVEQARGLVARELGPLARGDDETVRLAATLRVYLEEGSSLERAARRLGVHRNTINRRVRRAQGLLGRPLEQHTLELQVALAVLPVLGESGERLEG